MYCKIPESVAFRFPILGIDPGQTTGWCIVYRNSWKGPEEECRLAFAYGEFSWPKDVGVLRTLMFGKDAIKEYELPKVVVFEGFRLFPQVALSFTYNSVVPIEVVGYIKGSLQGSPDTVWVEQLSSIKAQFKDWQLREMVGDRFYPSSRHARDAMRHVLHYIMKESQDEV